MAKRMCLALAGTPSVLLSHLADDSSSSEDDDDGPAYEAMFRELFDAPCAVPKVKEYVLTVMNAYSDKEFRRNFRLARVPCYDLIDQFEGSSFFSSTSHHGGSPTKTAEEHILSFHWYVANKSSMRECALLFNMADSTVLAVIDRVLEFLCSIAPDIICFAADKGALANDLKKRAGFPNVIGCIDGTYIPTRCPITRQDQPTLTGMIKSPSRCKGYATRRGGFRMYLQDHPATCMMLVSSGCQSRSRICPPFVQLTNTTC
ncbi:unnamed protein product [Ixodes persulcatus]